MISFSSLLNKFQLSIQDSDSILKYERQIEKNFYNTIKQNLDTKKFSILRILTPVIHANKHGFLIYTGLTDNPPAISKYFQSIYFLIYS